MNKLSESFKSSVWVLALLVFAFAGQKIAAQNVTTPRPVSPAAEVKQTIGLTDITVNYSRPRVTLNGVDRSGKIWGQQVPYGLAPNNFGNQKPMPWRAGANENTTISFTDDVKIEGKDLPAGTYGLHMLIQENGGATIIFSKNTTSWGSFFYEDSEDALRVDVKTKEVPHTEVLTYDFIDMGNDYAVLALSWEKKQIPFRIDVDVHKTVLANFRKELRSLPGFGWQGFQTAANYCFNNNINHEEALQWAEVAVTRNKSYPTLATKAGLLAQAGKQAESDKVLDEAAAVANKQQLNALGYQLLGQKRFAKAIQLFELNVKNDPTDPNSYDSLGEAYKQAGNKEKAIENLKKALTMNPPPAVRANSEKLLKELGAM
ncbi:MAG: DUF2911 domain-containing protein [Pyrinomonadaceae bacterium]